MPTSNLKLATPEDLPEVIELVRLAYTELPYPMSFSLERVHQVLTEVLDKGVIICLMDETRVVGVFIALKTLTATSMEWVASELLWYVRAEHRKSRGALELLKAFEYWGKEVAKVSMLAMGNMQNEYSERTHKLYLKNGYELSEQTYFKSIKKVN